MSAKEAKGQKKVKKVERVEVKPEYIAAQVETNLPQEIIQKAKVELPKEKFVTAYRVAQRYGIKISAAKRLLKILSQEGIMKKAPGSSRRTLIYVPAGS